MKKRIVKMAATLSAAALMFGNTATTVLANESEQEAPAVWCYGDGSCDVDGICLIGDVCDGSHGWCVTSSDDSYHDSDSHHDEDTYHDNDSHHDEDTYHDNDSHHDKDTHHDSGSHHSKSKHHH